MIYLDVMSEIAMVRYVVNNNIHHACTELRKKIASSAVVVVGVRRRRRSSSSAGQQLGVWQRHTYVSSCKQNSIYTYIQINNMKK